MSMNTFMAHMYKQVSKTSSEHTWNFTVLLGFLGFAHIFVFNSNYPAQRDILGKEYLVTGAMKELPDAMVVKKLLLLSYNFLKILFVFDCAESLLLCRLSSSFRNGGLVSSCNAQPSHSQWLLLLGRRGSRARGLQ